MTRSWPGSNAACATTAVAGGGLNEGAENVGAAPVVGIWEIAGPTAAAGGVSAAGAKTTGGESAAWVGVDGGARVTGLGPAVVAGVATAGGPVPSVAEIGDGSGEMGTAAAGLAMLSEGRTTGAVVVDPVGVDADGVSAGLDLPLVTGATGAIGALSCALAGTVVLAVTAAARFANTASVAAPRMSAMRDGECRWLRISAAPTPPRRPRHATVLA